MRVVQINGSYGMADSTGRNTAELHQYLLEQGVDSWVFAFKQSGDAPEWRQVEVLAEPFSRPVHALLSRLTGLQGYYSAGPTRRLLRKLDFLRPELVVLGVLHSNCISFPILMNYLAKKKIAVALVLHDCWFFTGHCCHYTAAGCSRWETGCGHCPARREWNTSWFFDRSVRCLKDKRCWYAALDRLAVVGVSEWITNEARRSILKNAVEIRRIYNWVDTKQFRPRDPAPLRQKLGLGEEKMVLGVASVWSEGKGLGMFIRIAREHPDMVFVLVGRMAEGIPLPPNLRAVGLVKDPEALAEYYAAADLFANPSVQETFGKTTAEALASGTPVLVYNTTACPELVGEGCGRVAPLGDEAAFSAAIPELLAQGKEKYGPVCRAFALERFGREKSLAEYLDLFRAMARG